MVQDYTAPVREYDYAFEYVMEAYEKRFGENGCPDIPIIKKLGMIFKLRVVQESFIRTTIIVMVKLTIISTTIVSILQTIHKESGSASSKQIFSKSKKDIIENNVYDNGHTIVRRCM